MSKKATYKNYIVEFIVAACAGLSWYGIPYIAGVVYLGVMMYALIVLITAAILMLACHKITHELARMDQKHLKAALKLHSDVTAAPTREAAINRLLMMVLIGVLFLTGFYWCGGIMMALVLGILVAVRATSYIIGQHKDVIETLILED